MTADAANTTDQAHSSPSSNPEMPSSGASGDSTLNRGKGFLEERPGHKSAMRAMSFVALVAAIGFGAVTLTYSGSGPNGIYITFGFLLAAFAPKALQKYAEKASPA